MLFLEIRRADVVFYVEYFAVYIDFCKALLYVYGQLFGKSASSAYFQWREYGEFRTRGVCECAVHHVVGRVVAHFSSAYGRVCLANPCVQQSQVVVYLGGGTHCGTRVALCHMLLYGYGWREAGYEIAVGL